MIFVGAFDSGELWPGALLCFPAATTVGASAGSPHVHPYSRIALCRDKSLSRLWQCNLRCLSQCKTQVRGLTRQLRHLLLCIPFDSQVAVSAPTFLDEQWT